ncbi:PREDICTED: cytochrome P450 CYP72A219-like [Ipomoea nil]|uniref:cytochrome P450 CYP72A219-like n=1 Tax=Ipomoea nil TaxID=35883 RepID=UPI0009011D8B|nr:PREDICTED: cytochrome P450 CYP72A219-like [Ipomoea nil]
MENAHVLLAFPFAVVIFVLSWRALNWAWLKPRKLEKCLRQQGFKGNSYRFLLGDLRELNKALREAKSKPPLNNLSDDIASRIVPYFIHSIQQYGKNCFIWLGPKPMVFITDPELIKEVFTKHTVYQKPGLNGLTKLLAEGLDVIEEDKWNKHRKIINPAFHVEKLKHMLPAFYTSCAEMLGKWEKIVAEEECSEIDVWPHLQQLTCDAISRTAFGSNYQEGRKIFELQIELAGHVIETSRSLYIPGWRFIPTKKNRRMMEIDRQVQASIGDIIEKRVKAMEAGEATKDDLLGILLDSNFKEIEQHGNNDFGMTTKEVVEECKVFYFAGQETSAVLLVWTMVLLSRHQEWQTLAREEVLQLFGKDKPNLEGLNRMKIVTMILNEAMRLYPPVPVLTRRTNEETKLGNVLLPSGVLISIPIILLHHNEELWGNDAKEFKPERFSEGVAKVSNGQLTFLPFGGGPRICIGLNFAMLECKMALAMILQRFTFDLSPSFTHSPITVFTIHPQYGAPLLFHNL